MLFMKVKISDKYPLSAVQTSDTQIDTHIIRHYIWEEFKQLSNSPHNYYDHIDNDK
jgi:hypothetical protein